jgi:pimeloyl-ACP methyl ester carboxylesterase
MHHVYLIPGFFGFSNLGDLHYFRAIREALQKNFAEAGHEVFIPGVPTFPTGSLLRRSRRLLDCILENGSLERAESIHLIGHSTGGLDARLLASFSRDLGADKLRERLRQKLKTVVCLSTPHRGTPLANFFSTLYGKNLLYVVTLLVIFGLWRKPIHMAAGAASLAFTLSAKLGITEPLLRQLTEQLLKNFSEEREAEVRAFLNSILSDVSLMVQLRPESMEVFDRTLQAWPEPRVVSYATVSPAPINMLKRTNLRGLLMPIGSLLYSTLYTITSRREVGLPSYGEAPHEALDLETQKPLPFAIGAEDNDGIVPTLSQIHGEFRGFLRADHLDTIGHYLRGPTEAQDGADWLVSSADFRLPAFEALWRDVTRVLLGKS